jgi:hypothetical protein
MTPFGRLRRATLFQFGAFAYLIQRDCAARFIRAQRPKICHLADWPLEAWKFRCLGLETDLGHFSGRPTTVQTAPIAIPNMLDRGWHKWRLIAWRLRRYYATKIVKNISLSTPAQARTTS